MQKIRLVCRICTTETLVNMATCFGPGQKMPTCCGREMPVMGDSKLPDDLIRYGEHVRRVAYRRPPADSVRAA